MTLRRLLPSSLEWKQLRDSIIAKRGRFCQDCAKFLGKTPLILHHVNKNPQDDNPDNLVLLCEPCHEKRHHTNPNWRDWKQLYKELKRR